MLKTIYRNLKWLKQDLIDVKRAEGKQKIFCIGRNKTGTTSLSNALNDLGYMVGDQRRGELLLDSYIKKDYEKIFEFCKTAEAFQDLPFSYPELYKHLDKKFPNSFFILSVRSSPEKWYNSITSFHSKLFMGGKRVPNAEDLKNIEYVEKGWLWRANRTLYNSPESDPYRKEDLIAHYLEHNRMAKEYFQGNERFLVIDLSEPGAYQKFCEFLGKEPLYENFPWKNKTANTTKLKNH